MNENQVKGEAKNVVGKVQEKVGQVTGSREQQLKGIGKQISGSVQKGVGNVEQALDDNAKENERERDAERNNT